MTLLPGLQWWWSVSPQPDLRGFGRRKPPEHRKKGASQTFREDAASAEQKDGWFRKQDRV